MSRKKVYVWAGELRVPAMFLLVLATLPLSILVAPSAVGASLFIVNSTDDAVDANPGDGVCATATGVCTLRAAIQQANAEAGEQEHIITLPAGTYLLTIPGQDEDLAATGDLDVATTLTISGAGAEKTIIDGNALDRVFHIRPRGFPFPPRIAVTMIGVTVRNGRVTHSGGGILAQGEATLVLISSVVTGNSAVFGGGIESRVQSPAQLFLNNSTVSGNLALSSAGGIIATSLLTLTNSTVSGNTAAGSGGGVYHDASGGTAAFIFNSTISGNIATDGVGGGVFEAAGTMTLLNSTLSGNMAGGEGGSGGGIALAGGTAILNYVTITNNRARFGGGAALTIPSLSRLLFFTTIIGGNVSPNSPDCAGTLVSEGYNLIQDTTGCDISGETTGNITGADPMLGPLADNGGLTQTHALLPGSPAIDAVGPVLCPASDQRGAPRLAPCDMGAFEFGTTPPAGPAGRAYVVNNASGTISVINTANNTVVGLVGVGGVVGDGLGPVNVALSPNGARLYVMYRNVNVNPMVIDTATHAIVAEVSLSGLIVSPLDAGAVSPDGTRLYLLTICDTCSMAFGLVGVVDTATNALAHSIPLGVLSRPVDVAVSPDGSRLYVLDNRFVGTVLIDVIDTATNTLLGSTALGPSGAGNRLAISPDGTRLYVTVEDPDSVDSVKVMNTATLSVIATVPVGRLPVGVAVRPDGAFVYVAISFPFFSPNLVSVIDTATNSVVATVRVGDGPVGVAVSPDGSRVYVTNAGDGTVSVIDTATNSVVATVPVGVLPLGVAVAPAP